MKRFRPASVSRCPLPSAAHEECAPAVPIVLLVVRYEDRTTSDNTGYDEVYVSAQLATLFPAIDYTDTNGQQVTASDFDVSYLYGSDSQHIGSGDLVGGEQQTQGYMNSGSSSHSEHSCFFSVSNWEQESEP